MSSENKLERKVEASPVVILLCTYNAGKFLTEQLDSIARQTHSRWRLFVSDDGSTDGTQVHLEAFRSRHPEQLVIYEGPGSGFADNFLSLVCRPEIGDEHVAFCDQDDVWAAEKLERAVAALDAIPADQPAVYCSTTVLIDETGKRIGQIPYWQRPPGLRHALVQNIATGNTMVFNKAARVLLQTAHERGFTIPFHDWALYQLVSAVGGHIIYDAWPSVSYRQHAGNQIGFRLDLVSFFKRGVRFLSGRYRDWNDQTLLVLQAAEEHFDPEARKVIDDFAAVRSAGLWQKILRLRSLPVYRQSRFGNFMLFVGLILGRV